MRVRRAGDPIGLGDAIPSEPELAFHVLHQPPAPEPDARQRLVEALVKARLRRPKRGRPFSSWRQKYWSVAVKMMLTVPEATDAEIARFLFNDPDGPNLQKEGPIGEVRTVQNWLCEIRAGRSGTGRKQKTR
jgi:hypothetical protein